MAEVPSGEFCNLVDDLASRIVVAVADFARERLLSELKVDELDQMSNSVVDMSAEMLFFGCDTWPKS